MLRELTTPPASDSHHFRVRYYLAQPSSVVDILRTFSQRQNAIDRALLYLLICNPDRTNVLMIARFELQAANWQL
jgi:hypothetical protein